jgi:hypothetical protein
MMIKRIWITLILIIIVLSACQTPAEEGSTIEQDPPMEEQATVQAPPTEEQIPLEGEAFGLYLVADEQITGADLKNYELDDLPLADIAIIKTEDLVNYDWEFHTFDLTEAAYEKLLIIFAQGLPTNGLPFVIVSHEQRIYAGAFWTPLSSMSFDGVTILQPMDPAGQTLFITLGYPREDAFTGEDPRGDPRLEQALEAAGVLRN